MRLLSSNEDEPVVLSSPGESAEPPLNTLVHTKNTSQSGGNFTAKSMYIQLNGKMCLVLYMSFIVDLHHIV